MAWLGGATVLLHRMMAFHFGQPVPEVIAVDLLILGLEQTAAAILLEPWFGFGALLFLGSAGVAMLIPALAVTAMLGSVIAAYSLAAVRGVLEHRARRSRPDVRDVPSFANEKNPAATSGFGRASRI